MGSLAADPADGPRGHADRVRFDVRERDWLCGVRLAQPARAGRTCRPGSRSWRAGGYVRGLPGPRGVAAPGGDVGRPALAWPPGGIADPRGARRLGRSARPALASRRDDRQPGRTAILREVRLRRDRRGQTPAPRLDARGGADGPAAVAPPTPGSPRRSPPAARR